MASRWLVLFACLVVRIFLLVLKKINGSCLHLSRCISTSHLEMSVVSGEVVLQQFSVLQVAFLLWLVEIIINKIKWNNVLLFIFCDIYFVLQALLNKVLLAELLGVKDWLHEISGERGSILCLCCFSCVASGCCWLESLVVDLLSSSFLQSPFFSLSVSWWKQQSQTCRTCSQQNVFCCLPCPFTALFSAH